MSIPADERLRARVETVRARACEIEPDRSGSPFVSLWAGDPARAYASFEKAKIDFWGHSSWQSTRPFAGRAIAAAQARSPAAETRCREIGQWFEGGSVEGHALALHALLGTYDRLEHYPPWPEGDRELTSDLADRLAARNMLLRPAVRGTEEVRLALARGESVAATRYTDSAVDDALAGEAALRAGDLEHAELRFRRLSRWRSSWATALYGQSDPRAEGHVGLARVARARKRHAVVLKECASALEIAPSSAPALLIGAATAVQVKLAARAREYGDRLRAAHPFADVCVDDLSRVALEAEIGVDDRRLAYLEAEGCTERGDHGDAVAAYERAAEGLDDREIAARLLFALASAGEHERLLARASELVTREPAFVSAREALAFALARTGEEARARELYRTTGLARLFARLAGDELSFEAWSALPVHRALSPVAACAEDRATYLFESGATDAGLVVLEPIDLDPKAPVRFLAAGSRVRQGLLRPLDEAQAFADEAWALIAPLACAPDQSDVAIATLAVEIAAATGSPDRVLEVTLPHEMKNYPSLTGYALARIAPHLVRALEARGRREEAEALLASRDHDAASIEAARTSRDLADEAWAHEQRGDVDQAIEAYLRGAEAHVPYGGLLLGNAGNLLTARGEHALALAFLEAAVALVAAYRPSGRAAVLDQVAHHFRVTGRHADALPSAGLAFDLAPTAQRAALLASDLTKLGAAARAEPYVAFARKREPRLPLLHASHPT